MIVGSQGFTTACAMTVMMNMMDKTDMTADSLDAMKPMDRSITTSPEHHFSRIDRLCQCAEERSIDFLSISINDLAVHSLIDTVGGLGYNYTEISGGLLTAGRI